MQDSDELVAIDLARQEVKWRIKTGPMPADVYGLADDKTVLVGLTGSDSVEVFDVSGDAPRACAASRPAPAPTPSAPPATSATCYLSNRVANTISKIDLTTLQVVDTYPAPAARTAWT
jgi:DNA-binding beta-propeller fold protein YncE